MKKENDELLKNLKNLDDNDIEELSDMVNFLDDTAKKRITEKCMKKTFGAKRSEITQTTNNDNEVKGVDVYMKKKIWNKPIIAAAASFAVIVGIIGVFALSNRSDTIKNPDNIIAPAASSTTTVTGTTDSMITSSTDTVTTTITETTTVSPDSYNVMPNGEKRAAVTQEEDENQEWYDVDKFISAINTNDSAYIAEILWSSEKIVDTWIDNISINSYNIIGRYKHTLDADDVVLGYYDLVEIDAAEGDGDFFAKGKHLYRFYAGSPISSHPIVLDEKGITNGKSDVFDNSDEADKYIELSNFADYYEAHFGLEYTEGNADVIFDIDDANIKDYMYANLFQLARNHNYKNLPSSIETLSQDTLIDELNKTLSFSHLEENINKLTNTNPPIEYYSPWYNNKVVSIGDNKVVIEYYADTFEVALAKKVEFTFKENADGSYCMTSVKNLYDAGCGIDLWKIND